MNKSLPRGPWIVTGMSKNGPWIKVRGTSLGETFKIANVPFTASESQFYAVEEAERIAHAISRLPDMVKLLKGINEALPSSDIAELLTSIGEA